MNFQLRFVAWLLLILVATSSSSWGREKTRRYTTGRDTRRNYEDAVADIFIARPGWFAATVVGAGIFVVSLPVAAVSRSVDKTAHALVVNPARATFRRPVGDFSTID